MLMWAILTVVSVMITLRSCLATRLSTLERTGSTFQSVCNTKYFTPHCNIDEVVVVTYAKYGRMERDSPCVESDYGHVGCGEVVQNIMDRLCSGKRTCKIYMPHADLNEALKQSGSCPMDFQHYLNISYNCVKVESSGCHDCVHSSVVRVTSQKGFISGVVTQENGKCGTASCPWQITVEPGQNINITLYDFSGKVDHSDQFRYATIRETSRSNLSPISAGQGRKRHVYTSVTSSIDVRIISPEGFINRGLFLIYYEAIGCPDYTPPSHSWMQREHSILKIGCQANKGEVKWEMVCENNRWIGDRVGKCPQDEGPKPDNPITLPLGVLIAIVIGIALVIGVLILTVGVVYLKKQQGWRMQGPYYFPRRHDYDYPMADVGGELYIAPKASGCLNEPSKYQPVMTPKYFPSRDNMYRRRDMQSRPLPSLPNIAEASGGSGSTASKSDDDPQLTSFAAEVHRSDSDRERRYLTNPRPSAARTSQQSVRPVTPQQPGGGAPRPVTPQPPGGGRVAMPGSRPMPPQYFILDTNDDPKSGRQAMRAAIACVSEAKPQKSPEQENAENASKEFSRNNSCHEIPLRPTRVSVNNVNNTSTENTTGKTSWP